LSGKSYVIKGKRYYILASAEGYRERGLASWYGEPFHGRKTASGEVYNMYELSAAHKTLPLHTWVEVRNTKTNQKLILRINDRGPFIAGRIIDLSRAAANELGVYRPGTAPVIVTALPPAQSKRLTEQRLRTRKSASSNVNYLK
jgi:rare lipoprotein A